MTGKIHLRDVLRLLDETIDSEGHYILHTVGFITYSSHQKEGRGRYRVMRGVHKTGLPYGVRDHQMRGVRQESTGEIRSVSIRLILMFDNMTVYW